MGSGHGVTVGDFDNDGRPDLFLTRWRSYTLLRNQGNGTFEDATGKAGLGGDRDWPISAAFADLDNDGDGRPDLVVTNFYGESTSFFRNMGKGMFSVESSAVGLAAPSRYLLGFGVSFLDANDDGRLDLAQANGHVIDDRLSFPLEMPAMLLIGGSDGRLVDVTTTAGEGWSVPRLGRGLAAGDLDNDGRTDVLILPQDSPLAVLRNETAGGRSLTLLLEGTRPSRRGRPPGLWGRQVRSGWRRKGSRWSRREGITSGRRRRRWKRR